MSTKLHNGFRFAAEIDDLQKVFEIVSRFRRQLAPLRERKAMTVFANKFVHRVDGIAVGINNGEEERGSSLLIDTWIALCDRTNKIESTKQRDPEVDFEFELSIHPQSEFIVGLYFTEQQEFRDLWFSYDRVEEYGYWDNADKPRSLTEEQWNERERVWNTALGEFHIPALSGLTATCTEPGFPFLDKDLAKQNAPTWDQRVDFISKELSFNRFITPRKDQMENPSDFIRAHREWHKWCTTDKDGKKQFKHIQEEVSSKINPNIEKVFEC